MTRGRASVTLVTFGLSVALLAVACGGSAASPTPLVTPTPAPTAAPTSVRYVSGQGAVTQASAPIAVK